MQNLCHTGPPTDSRGLHNLGVPRNRARLRSDGNAAATRETGKAQGDELGRKKATKRQLLSFIAKVVTPGRTFAHTASLDAPQRGLPI